MQIVMHHQSAFVVRSEGGIVIAVDFGQEVPADAVAAYKPAATFVSHQHPDHFHVPHVLALGAPVYAPADVIAQLNVQSNGLTTIKAGSVVNINDVSVSVFDVDHGPNLSATIDNLGFVFTSRGRRLLFLGDMGAPSEVPQGPWNLVLVPVGGSKVFSPKEAADYVSKVAHNGVTVPVHYHGRADRTSGEKFRTLAGSLCDVKVLTVGQELAV